MTASEAVAPKDRLLFGYGFAREGLDELVDIMTTEVPPDGETRLIVTANVDHIVQLRNNDGLRSAYRNAWRRTVDGMPVFVYGKLRGCKVPERVPGADIVPVLLDRLTPGRHRPFFVCATDTVANSLREWARERGFAPDAIGTDIPPFGFEKDPAYGEALAERIRNHATTHLLFAVGCPKSEIWIDQHSGRLGGVWALAVGASLSFFTGELRRAPEIMRRTGLEWLWRVGQEPRRLAYRYGVSSWRYWLAILDDIRHA